MTPLQRRRRNHKKMDEIRNWIILSKHDYDKPEYDKPVADYLKRYALGGRTE